MSTDRETVANLPDTIAKEMARVRRVQGYYKEIGPAGMFGAAMIEQDLQAAEAALASGDVVEMLRACVTLQETKG